MLQCFDSVREEQYSFLLMIKMFLSSYDTKDEILMQAHVSRNIFPKNEHAFIAWFFFLPFASSSCTGGQWDCINFPCSGICSVEGGSHISTYDEKHYNVHGDCHYVLSKASHLRLTIAIISKMFVFLPTLSFCFWDYKTKVVVPEVNHLLWISYNIFFVPFLFV